MTDKITATAVQDADPTDEDIAAAFLTDEEREALKLSDDKPDEEAAKAPEGDGADDQSAAADTAAQKPETADADPAGAEVTTADDSDEAVDTGQQAGPLLQRPDVSDATARLQAIPAERDAIYDRYETGDLDAKAMRAELAKLDDEAVQARLRIERASIAEEMAATSWQRSVEDFVRDNPAVAKNALTWGAFDAAVRTVTGDKANAGLSDRAQLQKAFGAFTEAFGIAAPAPQKAPQPEAQPAKTEKPRRDVPPTLATIPAAATTGTEDNRFSALDRLADNDPIAFEDAIARMSDADRQAYFTS